MFYDGNSIIIQSSESNDNGYFAQTMWSSPIMISQDSDNAYPRCSASITGETTKNGVAVWTGYDGSNAVIMASTGSKTLISPPTVNSPVKQNLQNYITFQDYYNTVTWSASPTMGITFYVIYRDGVYLTQVDSSTLQFVDNNQIQDGSVTYGVASLTGQSEHSAIATVSFP